jgi:formate dehydrogenase major subunit
VANTWGYGAMTNSLGDIQNAKAIIIFGANPAVNHPVGFQHFLKAKERNNAQIIVIDPVYTKTAAKADYYCCIRPGTDIAFMYGMLHLIFKNGWDNKSFVDSRVYGMDKIRKEAKKWTPQKVADVTGVSIEKLIQVTQVYAKLNPGTLIWAMGLTQHTIGSSNTRLAPILQLALGNMGVEGGGTNILRGHDNVQGATDMGCLPDSLPGYYGLSEGSWKYFASSWNVDYKWLEGRFKSKEWMGKKGFTLSRWWAGVLDGKNGNDKIHNAGTNLKNLIVVGNGITSIAQQAKVKEGLDDLDMIVLCDPFVNEGAILTDKQDNVFLLPAATQFETSGTVVATNRSVQWRNKVVEPLYEAKADQDILFELAKRLGFYDEYTAGMKVKENKKDFQWPEDATDEIARIIKTIGLTGWTAKRVKEHTENWHMFDQISGRGYGKMKGQYYGLPWPCWTEKHSGSPVLYNIDRSVAEGGMGFRNRFGLEREGVDLLAAKGSAPKGLANKDGYPEITAKNIEKVLGIKLTADEKKRIGKNWKVDKSNIIAEKCMERGMAPYGNAKARAIVWNFPDQIPIHREPLHSPREDLVKKHPSYADKENHYRVDTKYISKQTEQDWSKDFPINLITGRLVNLNGAGMETRASKYLAALTPEMFCNINPDLAGKYGIRDGSMMWIHSPEGTKIKVKAKYTHAVSEDRIWIPFHYAGHFQGEDRTGNYPVGTQPHANGESANTVTNYGYDIVTQIPETKGGLCRIEYAEEA